MKKSAVLALAGCLFFGSFAWGGGGNDNKSSGTGGSKSITVYIHQTQQILGDELKDANGNTYRDPSTAYLKQMGEKFTAQTGIKVEFFPVSSNGTQVMSLLQVQDKSIDMFSIGWTITKDQYEKYTAPVMSAQEASNLYGAELVAAMQQVNGNVHALNISKQYGEAITYNEDVIKAAGYNEIPGDLPTFNKMLQAIKDNGVTPISLHRRENWPLGTLDPFSNYVAGQTDTFSRMLGEPTPFSETAPIGKTIKMYTTWKAQGFFEQEMYPDFGVAMDSVAYGKAGMMLFGSWVLPQVQSRVPEGTRKNVVKFDAVPDFGKGRFVSVNPAQGYAINKVSTHIAECKQFLEFLATDSDYLVKIGVVPTHKNAPPGVPESFAIIDGRVRNGQVKQLIAAPLTDNNVNNDEVLKDANLLADSKWAGLPFDALDITKPNDWTAYNAQVDRQNADYDKYRKQRRVTYVEYK